MQERRDIYSKPKKQDKAADFEPLQKPNFRPPHRTAITTIVVMVLLLIGVYVYFNVHENKSKTGEYDHLLNRPAEDTNALAAAAAGAEKTGSIDSLLTDLGGTEQEPPPTMSPQKMSEAMALVRSAQQYIRSRDMDGAEREVGKALEVWPDMNIAIRLLGSIYTQRGQFDQAIVLLEKSLAKEPFSAETLNNLAINYMQKGMMSKAEELLITSLQIRPEYGVAYINLGFVHLRLGRYDLAAESFELGLKHMPENPGVLNNLAVSLIRLGDYEGAREKLTQLIELSPDRGPAYFNMAISYVLERNLEGALEWIRRGADFCTPSQLQAYLSDADFDTIRAHPVFQQIIRERFPDIPSMPPAP
jgi:Flp pilus assembly protein TadD